MKIHELFFKVDPGNRFFRSEETAVRAGRGVRDLKLICMGLSLVKITDGDPHVNRKSIRNVKGLFLNLDTVCITAVLNEILLFHVLSHLFFRFFRLLSGKGDYRRESPRKNQR